MESVARIVRELRAAAGLSQRALAAKAKTSQPAIARYENGHATPSLGTLQRLAAASGRRLEVSIELVPDQEDVELAEMLLALSPQERLRALGRYARLQLSATAR